MSDDGGLSLSKRRMTMSVIIGVIVSALGTHFCSMDFCMLYTFVSIGISIYKVLIFTDDKTALQ